MGAAAPAMSDPEFVLHGTRKSALLSNTKAFFQIPHPIGALKPLPEWSFP